MPSSLIIKCAASIAYRNWNIAFAESATAGRMCSEFSLTPDSGKILRGGICCYEIFIKEQILKVPHKLIKQYTAESAEVTLEMAKNATRFFNSNVTVAVTGLTAPGGSETEDKPVGTMFLCIITPVGTIHDRTVFSGSPEEIIKQVIERAAALITEQLTINN
ncbi:MAG: damage-inducible protein CinA [Flavobacterium psychrophilum]|nr:MAG: damage-inducible protein CinA [Flavobacterium psychrophilum]